MNNSIKDIYLKYIRISKLNKYIKLESKEDFRNLWVKMKWISSQCKPIVPFFISTIIINSALSLIGVYNAIISKSLIDAAISGKTSTVIQWLVVMATIMFGRMLISPITSFMSTRASTKLNQGMQSKLYTHLIYSEWIEQSKFHSVSLLTRITSDVGTISSTILGTIPSIISLLVTFIASFSTLIYFAPSVAIVAVIVGPILLLISRSFGRKLKKLYKEIQEEDIKYRSFIQESIQNLMIVKTFCMEKLNVDKLHLIQKNKYELAMKNTKLSVLSGMSMGFCSTIAYFSIFCWGALNISKGLGTYGTFTAMIQLYSNIQGPISGLANTFPALIGCISATERLMEIEEITLEDVNIPSIPESFKSPYIKFKNVSFSYKEGNPVINNVTFNIAPGEIIALIGPSGEGKTTLIRLLLSLIHCNEGEITLGSYNIRNNDEIVLNRNHRELISYVPQGNTLFSGTIEDNLRYGKDDANTDDIEEAAKAACALKFINKLEDNFHTLIGEKGSGVSEGQAQRLAIARALLRKRPILILDEVTSSLDVDTELNVLKSIKELDHKPTCIIITHRPSALSICDRILKLEKGTLKEIENKVILETAVNQ
ncbi:ABC transporter ATP-binding protein [Clostridium sulfidigenes]|uniref:ABC transporter ATP-binding protein n=1 Tax=Clostridium sulfidigenes TaxID=318464 RepID=UPI003F88B643